MLSITADRLFDGTGTASRLNPLVQVADGKLTFVGEGSASTGSVHFPGCTLLPGLIDTHVHLIFCAADTNDEVIRQVARETDDELLTRTLANARSALHAGLTTVRDCGGRGRVVQMARDLIQRGEAEGSDILSCGMPITTRTGHCHWLGLVADTPDEVRFAAERMLAEEADFLKVMATGGNMTRGSDPMTAQYDAPTLKMIADLGRSAGKHTAAHVLSRSALPGAVAAGVRTIEHCDWRIEEWRYEFDPELARRMIDGNQFAGITMSGLARRAFVPPHPDDPPGPVRRLDDRFTSEREMIAFGVRYTLHSDAGVRRTPVAAFALGLRAAVQELRLTPAEALVAATGTAAEALELSDRGTLEVGKRADLLVVEGNPLDDLRCLERVRAVMKAGKWVVSPTTSSSEGH